MTLAFLQNIGFQEYLVIAVILLLLFGRRLPEVGRSLGKGIVEFKKGLRDVDDEVRRDTPSSYTQQQFSQPSQTPPLGPGNQEPHVSTSEPAAKPESAS
ncbi:MAG: twin-arginine translocase TatA/TatE family subunit [Planctomycetota bacterium]|nr:MAG: twin-arginine translocase TatA/TatE family subunit [Planctomycetota bacterium]